jgi:hypothetical protein
MMLSSRGSSLTKGDTEVSSFVVIAMEDKVQVAAFGPFEEHVGAWDFIDAPAQQEWIDAGTSRHFLAHRMRDPFYADIVLRIVDLEGWSRV